MTATLPDKIPSVLPSTGAGREDWYYKWSSLYHNKLVVSSNLPFLSDLKPGQRVGILLTTNGNFHIYLDGCHVQKTASNLPVKKPLWGAVDVQGDCIEIKSELLSGKLDGVFMHACSLKTIARLEK